MFHVRAIAIKFLSHIPYRVFLSVAAYGISAILWCLPVAHAAQNIPPMPTRAATSMLPYLDWMLDPQGTIAPQDLLLPEKQRDFIPLNLQKIPPQAGGAWLRFTLSPATAGSAKSATQLLDMGNNIAGTPTMYVPNKDPRTGAVQWDAFTPSQRSIFVLPEAQATPQNVFLHLDSTPSIWFSPQIRTPHNAATAPERLMHPALLVALGVVMLLCLLRGLSERGEWRIWTAAYTAAALVSAIVGLPATPNGHIPMNELASVLAPGIALMLLPHVGRHLMRTPVLARAFDLQYMFLVLPGIIVALLPLVPGLAWVTRYSELWPALTLCLVPTTIGAWLAGLPGARRFLLGCLLPPIGVGVALAGIHSGFNPSLLSTAPLWGLALGALIIAGTGAPSYAQQTNTAQKDEYGAQAQGMLLLEDPNLRIVPPDPYDEAVLDEEVATDSYAPLDTIAPAWEEQLRIPLDALQRDSNALMQCALPPAARQLCASIASSVQSMGQIFTQEQPSSVATSLLTQEAACNFDLQELLRQTHDAFSPLADSKSIALSWFMPPHLAQYYSGQPQHIQTVLEMLLESAIRATDRGAVQLAVRRVPESVDPGHLLFSVTDTGSGTPPDDRSTLALVRAWELAGAHRGFLSVESSPLGAAISFTMRLDTAIFDSTDDTTVPTHMGIVLLDDSPTNRQLTAFFLEELPFNVYEARSAAEAMQLYEQYPIRLIIIDADMPINLQETVQQFRKLEAEYESPVLFVALAADAAEQPSLEAMGVDKVLCKPIVRTELRTAVKELLLVADTPDTMPDSADTEHDDDIIDTGAPLPDSISHLSMHAEPEISTVHSFETTEHLMGAAGYSNAAPQGEAVTSDIDGTYQTSGVYSAGYDTQPTTTYSEASAHIVSATNTMGEEAEPQQEPAPAPAAEPEELYDVFGGQNPVEHEVISYTPGTRFTGEGSVPPPPYTRQPHSAEGAYVAEVASQPRYTEGQETEDAGSPNPPYAGVYGTEETVQTVGYHAELTNDVENTLNNEQPEYVAPPESDAGQGNYIPLPKIFEGRAVPPPPQFTNEEEEVEQPAVREPGNAAYLTSLLGILPQHMSAGSSFAQSATAQYQTGNTEQMWSDAPMEAQRFTAPDSSSEWVGEPMPITPTAPIEGGAAASTQPFYGTGVPRHEVHGSQYVAQRSHAPQDSVEWVGEPTPITRPVTQPPTIPTGKQPSRVVTQQQPRTTQAPVESVEWVGEPMPIVRPAVVQTTGTAPSTTNKPQQAVAGGNVQNKEEKQSKVTVRPAPAKQGKKIAISVTPIVVPAAKKAPKTQQAQSAPVQEHVGKTAGTGGRIVPTPPASEQHTPSAPQTTTAQQQTPAPKITTSQQPSVAVDTTRQQPSAVVKPTRQQQPVASTAATGLAQNPWTQAPPLMDFIIADDGAAADIPAPPQAATVMQGTSPETNIHTPHGGVQTAPDQTYTSFSPNDAAPAGGLPSEVEALLNDLDRTTISARNAFESHQIEGVQQAAQHICAQSERYGLRTLARMARCVENAARAKDEEALHNLLPEMELFVERNRRNMRE